MAAQHPSRKEKGPSNSEKVIDMTGEFVGGLEVIGRPPAKPEKKYSGGCWMARCLSCGGIKPYAGNQLRNRPPMSCGCRKGEFISLAKVAHGAAKRSGLTPEFKAWRGMFRRCYDPKARGYKDYGGRGIAVCDKWKGDFAAFLAHVGQKPSPEYSLDRVDNSKDYEPGNVKWSTRKEQCRNKRNNRWLEFRGEVRTMAEWSEVVGISQAIIRSRLHRGWSTEDALTRTADRTNTGKT